MCVLRYSPYCGGYDSSKSHIIVEVDANPYYSYHKAKLLKSKSHKVLFLLRFFLIQFNKTKNYLILVKKNLLFNKLIDDVGSKSNLMVFPREDDLKKKKVCSVSPH